MVTMYPCTRPHVHTKRKKSYKYLQLHGAEFFDVQSYDCPGQTFRCFGWASYATMRILLYGKFSDGRVQPFDGHGLLASTGAQTRGEGRATTGRRARSGRREISSRCGEVFVRNGKKRSFVRNGWWHVGSCHTLCGGTRSRVAPEVPIL